VERHAITFDDLVGLLRLDHVELGAGPTPLEGRFLNLITDLGRFTFAAQTAWRDPTPAIDPDGVWEPDVAVEGLGLIVTFRIAPTAEKTYRRVYCVDEATGLVVLELGSITRTDDPNLRGWRSGVFRWEGGVGWDSPYLYEAVEVDGVEIRRKFAFTPKNVRATPRKGRF
jgi:hypothetical protein